MICLELVTFACVGKEGSPNSFLSIGISNPPSKGHLCLTEWQICLWDTPDDQIFVQNPVTEFQFLD